MNLFLPSIQFRWYLQRLAMPLAVLLPLMTNGCMTYRMNNLRDTPDTIPGDRKCERAVLTGSEAGAPDGLRTLRAAVMESNASVWKDTVEDPQRALSADTSVEYGQGRSVCCERCPTQITAECHSLAMEEVGLPLAGRR